MIKTFENFESVPNIINDDYYKLCISLAKNSKADEERYGAVLVKNEKIIGMGYNRCISHPKFKLDRILKQGYANHAEVESMNDALMKEYDINESDIYVAGYFNKTKILFFKKYFTCVKCIPYMKKFNIKNIFTPSPDSWIKIPLEQAYNDAIMFKGVVKGDVHSNRLKFLIGNYNLDLIR